MSESTSSKRSIIAKNFMKQVNSLQPGQQITDEYFGIIKYLYPKDGKKYRMLAVSKSTIIPSGGHSIRIIRSFINAWKERPESIDGISSLTKYLTK